MPRSAREIFSRFCFISGLISSSLASMAPVCMREPLPLSLPTMTFTRMPARTMEMALPMATAGDMMEMACWAFMATSGLASKIRDRGVAPAPMPPPMMGRATSSSALMTG